MELEVTLHTKVRRAALLAYLERGWTGYNAIKVHLAQTGALRTARSPATAIASDLEGLMRSGEVERQAVPGVRDRWGREVYSYRRALGGGV
jgi:hypothetical protein